LLREVAAFLLAVGLSACAAPSPSVPATSGPTVPASSTGSPTSDASSSSGPASPRPSVDGHPLSELLPSSVNGEPTTRGDLSPSSRNSPRVFLKVVARLGKTPPEGEVAIAANTSGTVYALRVKGASGDEVLLAFVGERANVAVVPTPIPTISLAGKQVARVGRLPGTFLYASGDVFFYIECPDEPTAEDVIRQLP
jgi:hypothetical protein